MITAADKLTWLLFDNTTALSALSSEKTHCLSHRQILIQAKFTMLKKLSQRILDNCNIDRALEDMKEDDAVFSWWGKFSGSLPYLSSSLLHFYFLSIRSFVVLRIAGDNNIRWSIQRSANQIERGVGVLVMCSICSPCANGVISSLARSVCLRLPFHL